MHWKPNHRQDRIWIPGFTIAASALSLLSSGCTSLPEYSSTRQFSQQSTETAQAFQVWYRQEQKNMDWLEGLPSCPEHLSDISPGSWQKPSKASQRYHPGGTTAVRSKPVAEGHGSQCVFDADGNLMRDMPAAGSADYASPVGLLSMWRHYVHDVWPFIIAQELGRVEDYYKVRPSLLKGRT